MSSALLAPLWRKPYILGGKAKITLVSTKSGCRFTFRIRAKEVEENRTLYFVSVLTGPENTSDFSFLGTIFNGERYAHGSRSKIAPDAPSAKAFSWLWSHLASEDVEVWHSGRCGRCNRELTTPESIERGIGPVCAGR